MSWRNWFTLKPNVKAATSNHARKILNSDVVEGNPVVLAQLWLTVVIGHYEALEKCAQETGISINELQAAHLFRQVCLFYDALWYYLLPQRVIQMGRVPHGQVPSYIDNFRHEAMHRLALAEYLPASWRDWAISVRPKELQTDFDLYMHGKMPREYEQDYAKILNMTKTSRDGSTLELITRLHLRTYLILGLFDYSDPRGMLLWWLRQSNYALGCSDMIMNKLIPIP